MSPLYYTLYSVLNEKKKKIVFIQSQLDSCLAAPKYKKKIFFHRSKPNENRSL